MEEDILFSALTLYKKVNLLAIAKEQEVQCQAISALRSKLRRIITESKDGAR